MIAAVSRGGPWLRRYGRALTYAGRDQLAYPAALLTRGVLLVIFVFVFNTLWRAIAGDDGQLRGLTVVQLTWYLVFTEMVELARPTIMAEIQEQVQDGSIAYGLVRPYSYPLFALARAVGQALTKTLPIGVAGAAVALALVGPLPGLAAALPRGLILLAGALLLNCLWNADHRSYRLLVRIGAAVSVDPPEAGVHRRRAAAGFGLGAMVCGNSAYLSRIIYQGDLDVYLTQPKPVLPNLLASRMSVSSWGDLLYGLGLVAVSQPLTPAGIGLFLLFVLLAAGVLVAVRVLYHSLTFLLGNAEDLAGLGSEQIITFSLYPGTIFDAPVVAVILHTLIPAALVAHLPADLFRAVTRGTGLDWGLLAVVIGGDAALIAAACAAFALGLRRYESGNRIGARI